MAGSPTFYPAGPIEIRDGTANRIAAGVPGLAHVYKARLKPGQDANLPYAVVWNGGERTTAWGDGNTGAPTFDHTLTLVVDVMAKAGTEAELDTDIVGFVEAIRAVLLTDASWVSLVEGIEKIDTRYAYPKDANDLLVQAMIEIEVTFKSAWPPEVLSTLKTVAVTTPPGTLNGFATTFDNLDT